MMWSLMWSVFEEVDFYGGRFLNEVIVVIVNVLGSNNIKRFCFNAVFDKGVLVVFVVLKNFFCFFFLMFMNLWVNVVEVVFLLNFLLFVQFFNFDFFGCVIGDEGVKIIVECIFFRFLSFFLF